MPKTHFCKINNISVNKLYHYLYKFNPEAIKKKETLSSTFISAVENKKTEATNFISIESSHIESKDFAKKEEKNVKEKILLRLKSGHEMTFNLSIKELVNFVKKLETKYEEN